MPARVPYVDRPDLDAEGQQIYDSIRRDRNATTVGLQFRALLVRHDLIIVAGQHQRRHGDRLQVVGLVGFRKRLDAFVMCLGAAFHPLSPPVADHALMHGCTFAVEPVERAARHIDEELRAIGGSIWLVVGTGYD